VKNFEVTVENYCFFSLAFWQGSKKGDIPTFRFIDEVEWSKVPK